MTLSDEERDKLRVVIFKARVGEAKCRKALSKAAGLKNNTARPRRKTAFLPMTEVIIAGQACKDPINWAEEATEDYEESWRQSLPAVIAIFEQLGGLDSL